MHRYALKIEYDGAPFSGWQRQDSLPACRGRWRSALAALGGAPQGDRGGGRNRKRRACQPPGERIVRHGHALNGVRFRADGGSSSALNLRPAPVAGGRRRGRRLPTGTRGFSGHGPALSLPHALPPRSAGTRGVAGSGPPAATASIPTRCKPPARPPRRSARIQTTLPLEGVPGEGAPVKTPRWKLHRFRQGCAACSRDPPRVRGRSFPAQLRCGPSAGPRTRTASGPGPGRRTMSRRRFWRKNARKCGPVAPPHGPCLTEVTYSEPLFPPAPQWQGSANGTGRLTPAKGKENHPCSAPQKKTARIGWEIDVNPECRPARVPRECERWSESDE